MNGLCRGERSNGQKVYYDASAQTFTALLMQIQDPFWNYRYVMHNNHILCDSVVGEM